MAKKNQQEAQLDTYQTNYEAEFEETCREKELAEYKKFCRGQAAFRGGYHEYREVMQVVRDEIRCRAELARINQEQREIKDFFLTPPICLMSEEEKQELLRLFAGEVDQTSEEFRHDEEYRYCCVPGLPPFKFSKQQGLVIKAIHEAIQKGKVGLKAETIFKKVGSHDSDYRLRRLFRSKASAAIDTGFLKELRTGFWTLDLMAGKRP